MKQALLFLIILITCAFLQAQEENSCRNTIQGVVLDAETKQPVPYVQIIVEGTSRFLLSDTKGEFLIDKLCEPTNSLLFSCLGYIDTTSTQNSQGDRACIIYLKKEISTLDAVTITAQRSKEEGTVSISQQSLSKERLALNPTQNLASALSQISGVTFTSTGNNIQLPVIHGLYGNRVLVLNNGIKHGFQNWGTDHAPEIDVSAANRITVLKGAAGVRYGPEALGGAIVVEADPMHYRKPLKGKVGSGFQSNGRGYFANAEIGQGFNNWSYHVGGGYTRIGDLRAPDYSLTNSGKKEISFNGGMRYRLKDLDFKIFYSYLNQNLAQLRSSIADSGTALVRTINSDAPDIVRPFSYDINEPNQLAQHHLGKFEADWRYSDDAKLSFRMGAQLNHREEYDVRRNADRPIIDLDLTTFDYQLEWEHPDWLGMDGLIGVQAFTQNNDNNPGTGTTPFIPNYNTTRFSAFIIENVVRDRNTFEFGVRLDHEYNNARGRETNQDIFRDEFSFTNFTASLGFIHRISEQSTFRTNVGTAWRTPNMSELYSFGQHGFKTSFGLLRYYPSETGTSGIRTDRVLLLSESEVAPERGYKWINEWQTKKNSNTLTLTAYTNYIENFIFDRPLAVIGTIRGPMPVFIHDQADALFVGADLSWQKEWSETIDGTLEMSYLWSRNIKKDEPLINQPPISVNYRVDWETPTFWHIKSSKITLNPSYTFQQFQAPRTIRPNELIDGTVMLDQTSEIFDFRDAPEGYFLLDLAWQLKFNQFDAGVSVQNVLNARYRNYLNEMRYFADEPGINILFSINYYFNSKSNQL